MRKGLRLCEKSAPVSTARKQAMPFKSGEDQKRQLTKEDTWRKQSFAKTRHALCYQKKMQLKTRHRCTLVPTLQTPLT